MNQREPMTMVSVRVPQDLKDRIADAARAARRTKSDFLRLFLEEHFPAEKRE